MKQWDYKSDDNDKLAKQLDKDNDIVFTKDEMGKYLVSLIDFKDGDILMEPCLGKGGFYNHFPSFTTNLWCEINKGKDYLTCEERSDYTLSNPPFVPRKLFWEFQRKAMELTNKEIYWLININSLNVFTCNRLEEMNEKGWYINGMTIVQDKRWFGRYVWLKINKEKSNFITFNKKVF